MNYIANNIRLSFDALDIPELTLSLKCKRNDALQGLDEIRQIISKGKELTVEIKQLRHKRSLDANGLLWTICNEIAAVLHTTKDEVYLTMLERYGISTFIVVKRELVDRVKSEWRAVRELGEITIGKTKGIQLQVFFGSHGYNTKEFSVLLDGTISEARELGINVITEQEKSLILQEWGAK